MKRIRAAVKNNAATFAKYAVVGATGTAIDVGLFALLVACTPLGASAGGRIVAATFTFVLAVANNYTWNRRWTFADRKSEVRKQFAKFFVVSCGGWGLNIAFLSLFSWILIHALFFGSVLGSALGKILASCVVLAYNFAANKLWTFRA